MFGTSPVFLVTQTFIRQDDKAIDVEAGFNAKTKTALVLSGYGSKEVTTMKVKPNSIAENFLEAVKMIMTNG